ncbi:hypothetical protein SE27_08645 [Acinetobacter harbinensis]|nr:hypothetical protein SE27_08645 [Acinetobacter harbinensis]
MLLFTGLSILFFCQRVNVQSAKAEDQNSQTRKIATKMSCYMNRTIYPIRFKKSEAKMHPVILG